TASVVTSIFRMCRFLPPFLTVTVKSTGAGRGRFSPLALCVTSCIQFQGGVAFGGLVHALVQVVGIVNLVAFAGLAAIAIRQWRRRRDTAAAWVALSLAALAFVATIGRLLPTHPHGFGEGALARVEVALRGPF